ncbi:leucine-rich repeat-containing protein 40-like isoform X1 [Schistocerca nitens]|uniref:leucine-rich repeat-containing protein 40-like isoform X1 n=1 Tax=Schistocerca nitens TaxID=7011 RepID=UPI002117A440|nr:leucine-rich repeat-containing protein 40-like isoform X1 [Schistocerca nitens]
MRHSALFSRLGKEECDKVLTTDLIKETRRTGELDLSNHGLAFVPEKVWTLENLDDIECKNLNVDMEKQDEGEKWWEYSPLTTLDLSQNCIVGIPPDISNLDALTILKLSYNSLQSLPKEMGMLRNLMELYLDNNKLKTVPEEMSNLKSLLVLKLGFNEFESIPFDIACLNMLQTLDLSYNSLTFLPPGIGFLTHLTSLDLSHNQLTEIPPDLVNLLVLKHFWLNDNKISDLPPLGELRKLYFLNLGKNSLTRIPNFMGCESLKELLMGNNAIEEFSVTDVEGLIGIKSLDMHNNCLSSLPENIHLMCQVVRFDFRGNRLENLPATLCLLPHLSSLHVDGNPLSEVRRDVALCGTPYLLQWLRKKLDEANHPEGRAEEDEVVEFPNRFNLRVTRCLNLAKKNLADVPPYVFDEAAYASVTVVDLSGNRLTELPEGMSKLNKIATEINVECNLLENLPVSIGDFSYLQYLNVQFNKLTDLPESISELVTLRELVLACNRFQYIPPIIATLQSLEILDLKGNTLAEIDMEVLSQLGRLAVLDLSNNNISSVPPQLGNLRQLRSVKLEGNCFRHPRQCVLLQGTESLLSYLRDRIPQE